MTENEQPSENAEDEPNTWDQIKTIIAGSPEIRRDMIKQAKRDLGFNLEPWIEPFFGVMPDKKFRIEEIDTPMQDIAESIFIMLDEGYSQGQIAHQLGLWPAQVSRVVKDRSSWEKRAQKTVLDQMPWYIRWAAKLGLKKL